MTNEQRQGVLQVITAVLAAIQEAGEHGIPSGHLYALLMGKMSLDTYQSIIAVLVKANKITESGYVLRAVS